MCGIYGRVSKTPFKLRTALNKAKKLEYRGYDSYGFLYDGNNLHKRIGRINLDEPDIEISLFLFHCRWATHGNVSLENTHPIRTSTKDTSYYLVHNGTITNYEEIIENNRHVIMFGETDTRAIGFLLHKHIKYINCKEIYRSINKIKSELKGTYACVFANADEDYLIGFRKDNPLYYNQYGEVSSDPFIKESVLLDENEVLYIQKGIIQIIRDVSYNEELITAENVLINLSHKLQEEEFIHSTSSMKDEIHEQINLVKKNHYLLDIEKPKKIMIFGMGSSYNAALLVKRYFSKICNIKNIEVEFSTEIDFNNLDKKCLYIGITQSGHTKDTLDAFVELKNYNTICVTNNLHSPCASIANNVIYIEAEHEQAVVATKSFTMTCLSLLKQCSIWNKNYKVNIDLFSNCIQKVLNIDLSKISSFLSLYQNIIILGCQNFYPISQEISLKIKEACYIHSEAMIGSQLKHGSLTLVSPEMAFLFIMTNNEKYDRLIEVNISQVLCRSGKIVVIGKTSLPVDYQIDYNSIDEELNPLLVNIIGQIISYNISKIKNIDSDKPRNICKSVTVN